MQGKQEYQQELFFTVDINSLVPQNHLLRKIDKCLDLKFVRELTEPLYCKNNGRPSIDPELFVRMLLIQYFYKIASDRQLCEEIGFNLAYRWFCRLTMAGNIPHHSSLTRIRDRFGEKTFKSIFEKVVDLCISQGLVKKEDVSIMVDGSLIKADASLDSLKLKDDNEAVVPSGINKIKNTPISNQTHVSKSDPECTIAGKTGVPKNLYYKAHTTIDSRSRVILDNFVTTGSVHEVKCFDRYIENIENKNYKISEFIADSGYGSAKNHQALKDKEIETYMVLWRDEVGNEEEGFHYDREKNIYTCPMGKELTPLNSKNDIIIYRSVSAVCKACPHYEKCVPKVQRKDNRGKMLRRNINQELYEEVRERSKQKIFKDKLRERMWKIEGIFGEAKTRHLFGRAKYRGLSKLQIQVYMVSTVQNLKRLVALEPFTVDFTRIFEKNTIFWFEKFFFTEKILN